MAMSYGECRLSKLDNVEPDYGRFFAGHTGIMFSGKSAYKVERYLKYSDNDLITDKTFLNNLSEDYKSLFDLETVGENKEELWRGKVINIMFKNELTR